MLRLIDEPRWRCATIPVRLLSSRNARLMAATAIASILRVSRARGAGHAKNTQLGPQPTVRIVTVSWYPTFTKS